MATVRDQTVSPRLSRSGSPTGFAVGCHRLSASIVGGLITSVSMALAILVSGVTCVQGNYARSRTRGGQATMRVALSSSRTRRFCIGNDTKYDTVCSY